MNKSTHSINEGEMPADHLKTGYDNLQRVIQMLDTKGNILIGLTTVIAGFGVELFKWNLELPANNRASWEYVIKSHPGMVGTAVAFLSLSLIAYVGVIICCLFSVAGRKSCRDKTSLLFAVPVQSTNPLEHRKRLCAMITEGNPETIKSEYADQLAHVGVIVSDKLRHNRWATRFAGTQILSVTVAVFFYFIPAYLSAVADKLSPTHTSGDACSSDIPQFQPSHANTPPN